MVQFEFFGKKLVVVLMHKQYHIMIQKDVDVHEHQTDQHLSVLHTSILLKNCFIIIVGVDMKDVYESDNYYYRYVTVFSALLNR